MEYTTLSDVSAAHQPTDGEAQSERVRFFAEVDAAFRALRADPVAWAEELREREEWDAVLADDLDPEPDESWTDSGAAVSNSARPDRESG